jgi:undecaprenyl-diphosphatase
MTSRPDGALDFGTAALLGLVQGLTEFLPISSKGHLVIVERLLGVHAEGVTLEVALHIGTLLAVVLYYWRDLWLIAVAVPGVVAALVRARLPADPIGRLFVALALGTLPAVAVVLVAGDLVESVFHAPRLAFAGFALTGFVLLTTRGRVAGRDDAGIRDGLLVGAAQAFAVLPGVSRSGTTIAAGVAAGLSREAAARFSFLLSIPAVLGAVVHELPDLLGSGGAGTGAAGAGAAAGGVAFGWPLVLGVAVSFVTGLAAIRILLVVARRNRLDAFSWYLWALAAAGFLFIR